ncbi:Uncharacterised protein [uncultured archaeon]|nr:Uncharacterised protein [uncultured archaeon]
MSADTNVIEMPEPEILVARCKSSRFDGEIYVTLRRGKMIAFRLVEKDDSEVRFLCRLLGKIVTRCMESGIAPESISRWIEEELPAATDLSNPENRLFGVLVGRNFVIHAGPGKRPELPASIPLPDKL